MERFGEKEDRRVVGGVDTHKDLHVAAIVAGQDRVLASQCFPTTRHSYKQMLAWMRSFGSLQRIGVEATGTYGAGLLRYLQHAGVEVLEVTAPDTHERGKRGENDDLDAQNAAHAAFAGRRTVTPKSRDGMIESLRVLSVHQSRKSDPPVSLRSKAWYAGRRANPPPIHTFIVSRPKRPPRALWRLWRDA